MEDSDVSADVIASMSNIFRESLQPGFFSTPVFYKPAPHRAGSIHFLIDAASSLKAESLKRGLVVLLPRALCSSFVC